MIKIFTTLLTIITLSVIHAQIALRRRLPAGNCLVTANVTCNVIGSNIPCSQVVTPTNKCGPTPVKYTYRYSNKDSYSIWLNYSKFWVIMDGSNQRNKVDTSPMKPGEMRFYVFNHTLNTCSVGTYGQIKVEGWLNVTTSTYCYAYDFVPNPVNTVPNPTTRPTRKPTSAPARRPTPQPISKPTMAPLARPTLKPTKYPTVAPVSKPTLKPNVVPSSSATVKPSRAQVPVAADASRSPTKGPASGPVKKPSRSVKKPF